MAYRYGDRYQRELLPNRIEDYIAEDAPVRAYDAFGDAVSLEEAGIAVDPGKVGCPQYDPRAMLKLLLYGYSYGVRSSRKLERECHYNVSFMWLMGGLKPDHKTIAEFRRRHGSALKQVFRQCARLCLELDLVEGNTLFVDGTPMRGNASLKHSWTSERCRKVLLKIDERVEALLSQCEEVDRQESGQASLVKLREELKDRHKLQAKVEGVLDRIAREGRTSLNTTDEDCVRQKSPQGSYAGYNVQSVVDEKHGLIVQCEATDTNEDTHQFARQISEAEETLGEQCETACGDCGYHTTEELKTVSQKGVDVIVPSRQQAQEKADGQFDKAAFEYDEKNDVYTCPEGQTLRYRWTDDKRPGKPRSYQAGSSCRQCRHFGVCTTASRNGRRISRYEDEEFRELIRRRYLMADAQSVYKLRKEKVELPFGHWKRNLKMLTFWLRGLTGVNAEVALLGCCFNLRRMITLLGVPALKAALAR